MTEDDSKQPEVLPALPEISDPKPTVYSNQRRGHERNEELAGRIRSCAELGLSKGNTVIAVGITPHVLDKYYLDDYLKGVTDMQKCLATKAIQEAMEGNTPILLHLLKTKLGWSEQQIIEHVGEIKAVVSAKPLTKDEFVQKYLTEDEES